jgi:PAS domain S-box-containing protein
VDEHFLHDEFKRQKAVGTYPAWMQQEACATGVPGDGGQKAMDANQRFTTQASDSPQRVDIEPQSMLQEMRLMSLEEVRRVVATLHAHQDALEHQNEALRQTQRALEADRDKYVDLYDCAPVGYLTLDADGAILEANRTATTLLGVSGVLLLRAPLVRFVAPADQETFLLHYRRLFATRIPQTSEVSMQRQDGVSCHVIIRSILGQEEEGAGPYCYIVLLERTDPLQVEEGCPQPSTACNEQQQGETVAMPGAEQQALLGRLAGALSHEIRNPCNSVFLHTDLLTEELQQLPPASCVQMAESLAEIKSEVTRLHDMMQDYLILARLADLQKQSEELGPLVEGVSMEMDEPCAARGITLRLEGLDGLGAVVIHKTTLRHALFTLIHQAMGAMPASGTLTLRGRQEGHTVHLEVSTSGPGFPEEELSRVFEPWHTLQPEGPGLGLYVARAIVVAHGGTLTVQRPPGHGTSFTMTLPWAERA